MQVAYIKALYEIMQADRNVVSLLSDSGTAYDVMMASEMPAQCFNFGISEQNKVGAAAGMALCGKIPFVCTSGAFLAYRSYEFIRNDICYQNQNVKIVGIGSGTSLQTLGPSHHTTEDLSALRALPNLKILSPATPSEAAACVRLAYTHHGPVYIRLGMSGEKEYFEPTSALRFGGSAKLRSGTDVAIFVTGSILEEVMKAAELLCEQSVTCSVYDLYSVKPMDRESILNAATSCRIAATVEEHNVLGGLGGTVSELLTESGCNTPLLRIGLYDVFASGYGTQFEVRKMNGLDSEGIAQKILSFFRKATEGATCDGISFDSPYIHR